MKLGTQVGVGPGHIVLDGDPATLPERAGAPQFSAHICHVQIPAWIRMTLGRELNLSPGDYVLDRDQAPPKKAAEPPSQFSAYFYCGQTAGCIKLSSGDFVLDGDPCSQPPQKEGEPQNIFGPCILSKRLDGSRRHLAVGMKVGFGPGDFMLDGNP